MASNVAQRMEYVGGAAPTTLTGDLSDSGSQFNLADGTNYPTGDVGQFTLVINKGGATEEIVLCDSRVNEQITVAPNGRGYAGTVASTHSAGESVAPCWSSSAADQDNLHNASTSGVHGVAGNVVGDKDAQTLTNKIIDASKNTLSNIPQTAVTDLATTFTTKMGNPATAWAKGSLLVGTGAGTFDTQASGASGAVLTAQSDGSLAWKTPGTGAALTYKDNITGPYTPGVNSALAAVDSTNATVTFTAPASGNVRLVAAGFAAAASSGLETTYLGWLVHGSSTQQGRTQELTTGSTSATRWQLIQYITGLTAGQSYQFDLATHNTSASGPALSDITIEVWAAS